MKKFLSIALSVIMLITSISGITAEAQERVFGIDISQFNGEVDFVEVKDSGRGFVMIRLGYYNHLDERFWDNVKAAHAAGIDFGVYLYSYAFNDAEAKTEADFVLKTLSELGEYKEHFVYPVAYDIEDEQLIKYGKAQITRNMEIFCKAVEAAGYVPMVYSFKTFFDSYLNLDEAARSGWKIWLADWSNNPNFNSKIQAGPGIIADLLQYAEGTEDAEGIKKYDLDVAFDANSLRELSPYTLSGWYSYGGKWYHYGVDGKRHKQWQKINGKWYYFNNDGVMLKGWQKLSGKWYYFNSSGAMQTGWKKIANKWYYFNSSGAMLTGWKKLSGKWYYFTSSGAMKTGWLKLSGKWYYFASSGAMVTGSQKINGKWYKFNSSGVMQ